MGCVTVVSLLERSIQTRRNVSMRESLYTHTSEQVYVYIHILCCVGRVVPDDTRELANVKSKTCLKIWHVKNCWSETIADNWMQVLLLFFSLLRSGVFALFVTTEQVLKDSFCEPVVWISRLWVVAIRLLSLYPLCYEEQRYMVTHVIGVQGQPNRLERQASRGQLGYSYEWLIQLATPWQAGQQDWKKSKLFQSRNN